VPTKRCRKCNSEKPLTEFHRDRTRRDGLTDSCKECNCKKVKDWKERTKPGYAARSAAHQERARLRELGLKKCNECAAVKPAEDFYALNGRPAYICKECSREQTKTYRELNHEKVKARKSRYYHRKREELCAKARERNFLDPEPNRARVRQWQRENPDRYRANVKAANQRRRARLRGVPYESVDAARVFERDGWRCGICNGRVDKRLKFPHGKSASLDHIIPISRGGAHLYSNVQCAHLSCNKKKCSGGAGEQLLLIG
jgi:HNH endonuclease